MKNLTTLDVVDLYLEYRYNEDLNGYADLMANHLHDIKNCFEEPFHKALIIDFFKIYNKKKFMISKIASENIEAVKYEFSDDDVDKMYDYFKSLAGVM